MFVVAIYDIETSTLCERISFPDDKHAEAHERYLFERANLGEGLGIHFFGE